MFFKQSCLQGNNNNNNNNNNINNNDNNMTVENSKFLHFCKTCFSS